MFLFANTAVFGIFETVAGPLRHIFKSWLSQCDKLSHRRSRAERRQGREVPDNDEPRELPLPAEFWSILPLAITYGASRAYLVIKAFLGLRELDPSAYMNVKWSAYFPRV